MAVRIVRHIIILIVAVIFPSTSHGEILRKDSTLCAACRGDGMLLSVTAAVKTNRERPGMGKARWGVAWTDREGRRYRVVIGWGNSAFGQPDDKRFMRVAVMAGDSVVESQDITSGVDMAKGYNNLTVSLQPDGKLSWNILSKGLAASSDLYLPQGMYDSGSGVCIFTENTDLDIKLLDSKPLENPSAGLATTYTSIADFPKPADIAVSPEGVWTFLDRETNPDWARPGGRYTLGIRAAESDGWDIVLLDGAQTNASRWKPGMKKGRLTPTPFKRHYDLEWIDATFESMGKAEECSASLNDDGSILTLNFPLDRAILRFYRLLP